MTDIILIALMICGKPDGFIIKMPNESPIVTYDVRNVEVQEAIVTIMKGDSIVIVHEDKRKVCL